MESLGLKLCLQQKGGINNEKAAQGGYLRVINESQEDYLYPESYFIFVELSPKAQEALVATG